MRRKLIDAYWKRRLKMNIKEMYKQKLTTAEEAVKLVEDGWRVIFSAGDRSAAYTYVSPGQA